MRMSPFRMSARHTRLVALVACWAVMLLSLAPMISRLLACDQNAAMAACHGAHASAENGGAPHDKHELHLDHCSYCFTHAGSFALPPLPIVALSFCLAATFLPFLFFRAPRRLTIWAPAQARAPPL